MSEKRISIRAEGPLYDAIREYAKANDMEWSAAVRQLLKRGLRAAEFEEVYPPAPAGVSRRRVLSKGVY
jgi:hypothetical protein